MNQFIFPLLLGRQEGAPPAGPGGFLTSMVPFILIVAIFYFLIIRPQSKKQKETQKMLSAIKKGDKIVTAGGIHGIVQHVKDTTVIVKVDENTKLEFSRTAISVVTASKAEKPEEKSQEQPEQIENNSNNDSEEAQK